VLLAHMPPAIVRTYYPGELWRLTRHTLPDLPSLERELEQVRERGYALNLGEHLAESTRSAYPSTAGTGARWPRSPSPPPVPGGTARG